MSGAGACSRSWPSRCSIWLGRRCAERPACRRIFRWDRAHRVPPDAEAACLSPDQLGARPLTHRDRPRAHESAALTRGAVTGRWRAAASPTAPATALATAAPTPEVPDSPAPFTPRGLVRAAVGARTVPVRILLVMMQTAGGALRCPSWRTRILL